jgi:hypothetical protein
MKRLALFVGLVLAVGCSESTTEPQALPACKPGEKPPVCVQAPHILPKTGFTPIFYNRAGDAAHQKETHR